jgi:hypothetical protein
MIPLVGADYSRLAEIPANGWVPGPAMLKFTNELFSSAFF